jgi:enamine deaminase RidA (YjgF/YER057c/UK114 family)
MTDIIEAKLAELGLTLPAAAAPVAAYVPVVVAGGLAHVSGQLPLSMARWSRAVWARTSAWKTAPPPPRLAV